MADQQPKQQTEASAAAIATAITPQSFVVRFVRGPADRRWQDGDAAGRRQTLDCGRRCLHEPVRRRCDQSWREVRSRRPGCVQAG